MIDPLRTAVPPPQPKTTSSSTTTSAEASTPTPAPTPAPAAAPSPVATRAASFLEDAYEKLKDVAPTVNLSGAPSIDLPDFLEKLLPKSGPPLIHLDEGWTPQGQGYDKGRNELLTSYYNEDDEVLLSFQDKSSGAQSHQVMLGGKDGIPAPKHGGGVSTDGKYVYVADTDRIYVYRRSDLMKAEKAGVPAEPMSVTEVPGDTKDPKTGMDLVSSGSFMTIKDGYAYVGGYSPDGDGKAGAVWRYKIDPKTGELDESSRQGPIRAPDRAQGMAVVDGALMFTTGDKKLIYQPFDEEAFTADIEDRTDIANGKIDSWAQGFNIIDGELYVTYESGSEQYDGEDGRQSIQRIPLDELDLEAAGLTPEDLE